MARTTHRSTGGKKLYAVRDAEGQFKDIQTFERAHGLDVQRDSKAELMMDKKKVAKKKAKKAAAKKPVAKKKAAKKAKKK